MKRQCKIFAVTLLLAGASSCTFFNKIMHDEEPIARVGDANLYYSDIQDAIPEFVSPEDSAAMVRQYINKWATSILYEELAEQQLAEEEKNVDAEMKDYHRSLLRYRYEQRFINERLDTIVTDDQIRDYYEKNKTEFTLERPVLKVRFVDLLDKGKDNNRFLKKLSSTDSGDALWLEMQAREIAVKYFDSSDKWMDAAVLAREFGTDWTTMMQMRTGDEIKMHYPNGGDTRIAFICDEVLSGPAPLDYCSNLIRDIILSVRKHKMLEELEKNVVEEAMHREHFEIFDK